MANDKKQLVWTQILIGDGNDALRKAYDAEHAAAVKLNELLAAAVAAKHKCKAEQVRIQRKNGGKLAYAIDLSEKKTKKSKIETL